MGAEREKIKEKRERSTGGINESKGIRTEKSALRQTVEIGYNRGKRDEGKKFKVQNKRGFITFSLLF